VDDDEWLAIRPSARRHGISDERIRHVIATCPLALDNPAYPGQRLFLGIDRHGVPVEVGALENRAGHLVVVHAMRLRPSYRALFSGVWRWH